jgi:ubiquinone/menaquinone biosynthesis C-methylase UbiE
MISRTLYGLSQTARAAWYGGQYILANRLAPPMRGAPPVAPGSLPGWNVVRADLFQLFQQDWRNVEAGYYPAPADMLASPGKALAKALDFLRDLPAVNLRRRLDTNSEVFDETTRGRYPRYFLQNFHYQSDGWMTAESAARYDHQVEVLFTGGADAMRRQALVPIADWVRARANPKARHLDIACGTARFLFDLKRAQPGLSIAGLDLSEAYLRQARRTLRRYRDTPLVQGLAERLPVADGGLDLITCVYLFHELPNKVRRQVAGEMVRALAPGGRLVITDSIQRGDHAPYDDLLARFPITFHEPYYADYIGDDLEAIFTDLGLAHVETTRAFFSRVMVFDKA